MTRPCRRPSSQHLAESLEARLRQDGSDALLLQLTNAQIFGRSYVPEIERCSPLTRDKPPDQQCRSDDGSSAGNDNDVHQISALIMERIQIHPTPSSAQAPNRISEPGKVAMARSSQGSTMPSPARR